MEENNKMIIAGKLRKTGAFNIPTAFTNEYLAKEHEYHMSDCKSYLMKDKNDERFDGTNEKE